MINEMDDTIIKTAIKLNNGKYTMVKNCVFDGVTYMYSAEFDNDEDIDSFFDIIDSRGVTVTKSDRSTVDGYLTVFFSIKE